LVFIKKTNQIEIIFFLKNQNRFKPTGFGSVWFFRTKIGSNQFGSVFPVWLGFFWFGSVFFPVFFGLGLVRFFWFFAYKTETELKPNRTGRFFQNFNRFNRFFLRFGFFGYFFSGFLGLISFPIFLLTPNCNIGWLISRCYEKKHKKKKKIDPYVPCYNQCGKDNHY
jgi:hypothetical protein